VGAGSACLPFRVIGAALVLNLTLEHRILLDYDGLIAYAFVSFAIGSSQYLCFSSPYDAGKEYASRIP
jgi:hypothetical protein